jgi:hypothetical protein
MGLSPAPVLVSRSIPAVKAALAATFPDYRGRKVRIARYDRPLYLDLTWSGGTVDKVVLVDFVGGRIGKLRVSSPFVAGANDPVSCPPGAMLVVRSYFCGVDAGVTFYVHPDDPAGLLS